MRILPVNCEAHYQREFLSVEESDALFEELVESYNVTDLVIRMADGTEVVGEVGAYMFADTELTSFEQLPEVWGGRSPWPQSLAAIRDRIEATTGTRYQVARAIYYADGAHGMDFHRDLPAYGPTCPIASISLGAEREFVFRPLDPSERNYSLVLKKGSLLVMGKFCQERYEHGVPRSSADIGPRINLTFRKFDSGSDR